MTISSKWPSVYLRVAIGSAYLFEVADRFGVWGHYGQPHVSWGDWQHFLASTHQVLNFLPERVAPTFAVLATLGEGIFGLLIFIGLFTRWAAIGSCLLSFCFALSMGIIGRHRFAIGVFRVYFECCKFAPRQLTRLPLERGWFVEAMRRSAVRDLE